ncbi:MAG: aspartate-semialdehyde dehydrogenase, partial [Candidatus Geothermarchaeales archaeon]
RKAAVLGGTGIIGQRFVGMLSNHPWFKVSTITGRSTAGKIYGEAVNWLLEPDIPRETRGIEITPSNPSDVDADIVFSALPSDSARSVEPKLAKSGFPVVSNASAFRMDGDVPLVIPEVNPDHLALINAQKRLRGWDGFIVTDPNCTTINLALALKPLCDALPINKAIVTTMQAISGAGYPGHSALDIHDNVIPYIKNEEEKVERETLKILGEMRRESVSEAKIRVAASCNRVPTLEGHMESVYVESNEKFSAEEVKYLLRDFRGKPQEMGLPTAPDKPIIVREEVNRPQTRLDRMAGSISGMSITVGRIRRGLDEKSLRFTLLGHNTIRGAAGTALLTAELLVAEKYL